MPDKTTPAEIAGLLTLGAQCTREAASVFSSAERLEVAERLDAMAARLAALPVAPVQAQCPLCKNDGLWCPCHRSAPVRIQSATAHHDLRQAANHLMLLARELEQRCGQETPDIAEGRDWAQKLFNLSGRVAVEQSALPASEDDTLDAKRYRFLRDNPLGLRVVDGNASWYRLDQMANLDDDLDRAMEGAERVTGSTLAARVSELEALGGEHANG